jgi:hypothetical protein
MRYRRSNPRGSARLVLAAVAGLAVPACTDGTLPDQTVLTSVSPAGGAVGVSVDTAIEVEFSHPMHDQMTDYAVLHHGAGIEDSVVAGTWHWSSDRTHMTFVPAQPLEHGTAYTLHLGGGMMDSAGHHVDLATHGHDMGGVMVTHGMMDAWTMHGGMTGDHDMTGPGWQHPADGTYGMLFTFTTG